MPMSMVRDVLAAVPGGLWLTLPVLLAVLAVLFLSTRYVRAQHAALLEQVQAKYGVAITAREPLDAITPGRRQEVQIAHPRHRRGLLEIGDVGQARLYIVHADGSLTEYGTTTTQEAA